MAYFQILGTGPSTPITDGTGRNYRRRTAALCQHISTWVLIDATHDFEEQAEHAVSVTAVCLTGGSRDAAGGLGNLDKWLETKTPLYAPDDLWEEVSGRYGPFNKLEHKRLVINKATTVGDLSVLAFKVETTAGAAAAPTYGYRFDNGKKKVSYASDVKVIPPESLPFFKNNDLLVVDGAGWDKDLPTHRGALNHLSTYIEWGNQHVVFTHIGRAAPPHTLAAASIKRMSHKADLAYDFMKIPLGR
ncbi:MAG TPA: MBL fold metallo-hydrolase [Myxococcota bacterium]|nr:MBL fold metallo-hydrolase [Myxococcota bacterium]